MLRLNFKLRFFHHDFQLTQTLPLSKGNDVLGHALLTPWDAALCRCGEHPSEGWQRGTLYYFHRLISASDHPLLHLWLSFSEGKRCWKFSHSVVTGSFTLGTQHYEPASSVPCSIESKNGLEGTHRDHLVQPLALDRTTQTLCLEAVSQHSLSSGTLAMTSALFHAHHSLVNFLVTFFREGKLLLHQVTVLKKSIQRREASCISQQLGKLYSKDRSWCRTFLGGTLGKTSPREWTDTGMDWPERWWSHHPTGV